MEHRGTLAGQMALNITADAKTYRDGLGRADAADWRAHGHRRFSPGTQLDRVHRAMRGSGWLTLEAIAKEADIPETTVGSRIRDLRKPRCYEHRIRVKQVPRTGGLHVYRMGEKNG